MAESRLQRWSRRKTEVRKQVEQPPAPDIQPGPSPEERELAVNESLPEAEVLEKYGLPDPDTLELGADVTGFMRKEIPEMLRRKALRALWKSNPVLAVLDGLNDYDEDYTDAAFAAKGANTLYKVGQGLIDKKDRSENQDEPPVDKPTQASDDTVRPPETAARSRKDPGDAEPRTEAEAPTSAHPSETETIRAEVGSEEVPRYRPRMRFES